MHEGIIEGERREKNVQTFHKLFVLFWILFFTFNFQRSKFYSTKFEPPKKETKEKKLSDGIKKFLEQKNHEEQKEKERKRREYEELMALRSERDKNKIKKHLKVTKSANRSVLDDAVNSTDTAVTMQGPEVRVEFIVHAIEYGKNIAIV